jgi:hypothetical protein
MIAVSAVALLLTVADRHLMRLPTARPDGRTEPKAPAEPAAAPGETKKT